jgi:hypothetical protein
MSEDRLEKALEAMKSESASREQLAGARARVWEKLGNPALAACMEFRPGFRDYLDGRLADNRRLLIDDHLSRCPQCRAQLAELKGESKVIFRPRGNVVRWPQWASLAAAAALLLAVLYIGRDGIDRLLAPSGPRATVASLSGNLYRVPEGALQAGAAIGEGEMIRTGPGSHAVLRLADGSLAEVNERTELFVSAAWSGQSIHLQRGDLIVQAAKQRRGHLRIQTRDSVASVKGTVLAVSAGLSGTVVSVVEGLVEVAQPGSELLLTPGKQAATNSALASSVREAVSWSQDADAYIALMQSVAKIEEQMAALPSPALRTQSRLLQYLPSNVFIYGAVPNLGGTIRQAMTLAEQQAGENPVFGSFWNSGNGQQIKEMIARIQTVTPLLGDEIAYIFSTSAPGSNETIPMVVAEIQPGKQAELESALSALCSVAGDGSNMTATGELPFPYHLTATLMVASDTPAHLQWVLEQAGKGSATPFAAAVAERYRSGAGWLLGMDAEPALSQAADAAEANLIGVQQMKHLFVERRGGLGVEENEVTLTFKGQRMGMASWLAGAGSGGAAEYISSDAIFGFSVSIREPRQLFEEFTATVSRWDPSFDQDLNEIEARLGANFARDLAAAVGTELAFGLEGFSTSGPVWVAAVLANNSTTIDNSIFKIVDEFNAQLKPEEQNKRILLERSSADGRTWTSVKSGLVPISAAWTYDRGYLVLASDLGVGSRAIATRNGGLPLVFSPLFQQQLPSSSGLHPSAFAWLNTKGALQGLAALLPNPELQKLMNARDPILVVLNGTTEQIHAASRTRITGLIMDAMLLNRLSFSRTETPSATLPTESMQPGKH